MFDRFLLPRLKRPLRTVAKQLAGYGFSANAITLLGLVVGFVAIFSLWQQYYLVALSLIITNRTLDGLDGEVARLAGANDRGAFLDIVCDFIFYAGVVLGFALAMPAQNSLAAAFLLFCFMGTSSSFLTFAIMAERRKIERLDYPTKGFYYLGGLTEGAETIFFFCLCCLLPDFFSWFALVFGILCIVTTITRIIFAYKVLRDPSAEK